METINTCDIETSSKGEILDINLYELENSKYQVFANWNDFLTYLKNEGEQQNITRIHAHNGGNFDWVGLACDLLTQKIGHDIISHIEPPRVVGGCIIMLVIWFRASIKGGHGVKAQKGYKVRLLDSFRLLPTSLDKLANDFLGEGKLDVPSEFKSKMEDFKRLHPAQYAEYHKRDSVLLARILESLEAEIRTFCPIKKFPPTIGGLALKIFQTLYIDHKIYTPQQAMCDFEMRGYKGGFTQYLGDGDEIPGKPDTYADCRSYDVNSMYPAQMLANVFPSHKGEWTANIKRDKMGRIEPGIYEVDFIQSAGKCPIMQPINTKGLAGDYAWQGRGIFTNVELNELEWVGRITKVYKGIFYHTNAALFADFVRDIYAKRVQADWENRSGAKLIYKLILNNLYGKFGERPESDEISFIGLDEIVNFNDAEIMRELDDGYLITRKKTRFVAHRFPAIAAMITAYARMELLRIINHTNVRAIYCDTGSIKTQDKLPEHLIDNSELGKFGLESENFTLGVIGKKAYMQWWPYEKKTALLKLKGVPQKSLNFEIMESIVSGTVAEFRYNTPTKIRTALKGMIENPYEFLEKSRSIKKGESLKTLGVLNVKRNSYR